MNKQKGVVEEKGINDTYRGWTSESELNRKIYKLWSSMLRRVYCESKHNADPTYINVTLQLEWHYLSYFAKDILKIEGFDKERFLKGEIELDKDIKSDNKNKEYSLKNCIFVEHRINSLQAIKVRDNDGHLYEEHKNKIRETMINNGTTKGKNNGRAKKVQQYDLDGNLIKEWEYVKQITEQLGWDNSAICKCCNGKQKTAYGYIWKYVKE